jgi:hypothetical protein
MGYNGITVCIIQNDIKLLEGVDFALNIEVPTISLMNKDEE